VSILRRAWEGRAVGTLDVVPSGPQVPELPAGYGQPGAGAWLDGMRWQGYGAGEASTDHAMRLSAVYACLRLLSEAISTLPLDTFRRIQGTRQPYRPRPGYLDFAPPAGSRITYLSQVMMSLLTDGNAYVATPRDELGVPVALVPLDPGMVKVGRGRAGAPVFEVNRTEYGPLEIMHIAGMTLPGQLTGVSPLRAAREVVDSGRKAQEFGSSFFQNAAVPPAVIELPEDGSNPESATDRARRVATAWNETHGGASNAGKVGVLIGGAKLSTVAMSPADAEWLDSKRFGVSEIARFYGVPPHLIADASNSTSWGSGLAEQNLAFGQFSLRPWIERIEDAHGRLLTSHGLPDVFVKLNLDALLRASLADRYTSYQVGIETGFLLKNEARRLEDLPPIPGGDTPTTRPAPTAPSSSSAAPGGPA